MEDSFADHVADAVETLRHELHTSVALEDRTIRLLDEVKGDPGLSVLRVLGATQSASPVGAAAHGPNGVAIGVWRAPELYVARWPRGRRWVVGFRLTGGSRLSDYVGMEGRVPTRFEIGNWYGPVPDEVAEAFLDAGLLIDEPPFPVPAPPAAPPPRPATGQRPSPRPPAHRPAPSRSAATRPAAKRPPSPANRVCPGCLMHKAAGQFVPGSDLCVDCRGG